MAHKTNDLFRGLFPADIELRASDDVAGPPTLSGHFSVFDVPYEVNSVWEGRFIERIHKGAFRKTLAENGDKIKILFEHGQHPQLGNSIIAKPTELREDSKGAKYEATLLDGMPDLIVNGLREGLYGSSFRFNVIKDEWDDSPPKSPDNPDGLPERTIREAHVSEFGPVTFPANVSATAGVRSLSDHFHGVEPEKPAPPPDLALPSDGAGPEPTPMREAAPVTPPPHQEPSKVETETTNMSEEARISRQTEIKSRLGEMSKEYAGAAFPSEIRAEWDKLNHEFDDNEKVLAELATRKSRLDSFTRSQPESVETSWSAPQILVRKTQRDIFDSVLRRQSARTADDEAMLTRDDAKRAVEIGTFPHPDIEKSVAQAHVTKLLETSDDDRKTIARRILATGSPVYGRAFGKMLAQQPLTSEEVNALGEVRALSLTGAAGGFAVPFELDPTILPTSNSTISAVRAISRVIQIPGDEWRGVSSGAITASYQAEATETTDNAPTLAQPVISTEKAQAFIPFSIEVGMDWGGLQGEMSRLLGEAKDDLEADKFITGSGTNEPFGVITGATNTVNATTGQTFDAEDLYRLEASLPPRYRSRGAFISNRAIYNLVRQFVLTGQSNPWKDLDQATTTDGRVGNLLGYPAYEASGMTGTTATGVKFAVLGDFSRYVIVDRVGLNVETIQHLVGTNHRPTGQRGLYAFWRNGAKVVDANAFRVLLGIA